MPRRSRGWRASRRRSCRSRPFIAMPSAIEALSGETKTLLSAWAAPSRAKEREGEVVVGRDDLLLAGGQRTRQRVEHRARLRRAEARSCWSRRGRARDRARRRRADAKREGHDARRARGREVRTHCPTRVLQRPASPSACATARAPARCAPPTRRARRGRRCRRGRSRRSSCPTGSATRSTSLPVRSITSYSGPALDCAADMMRTHSLPSRSARTEPVVNAG